MGYRMLMSLNENAEIDTSQVEDQRGSGGGGGGIGGIPIPIGGGGRGGGMIGLIITVILVLAGGGFAGSQLLGGGGGQTDNSKLNQACSTANPDRLKRLDCRNTLYVNSIQNFWQTELPQVFGQQYQPADTVFFSQRTVTGCGAADSGVGPFYCPPDRKVYIDLTFYTELTNRFGARGEFAQPYVLAHEYGHHVQDLLGTEAAMRRAAQRDPGNENKLSVMLELQADCYSGVWSAHATQTRDAKGQPIFTQVTQQNIQDAVNAAGAVGDDTIQKQAGRQVNPDTFTHGTSAQREQWFTQGYRTGDPKACNTFGGALGG
jgi:predicted metalloprotease